MNVESVKADVSAASANAWAASKTAAQSELARDLGKTAAKAGVATVVVLGTIKLAAWLG